MSKKIAINGFGRIGRLTLRNLIGRNDVEVVAINDLTDTATLAHLFEFDSAHRRFEGTVSSEGNNIIINGKKIPTYAMRNPAELPWKDLGVDVVLECTGIFTDLEKAMLHVQAGARRVVISAPAKDKNVLTIVRGVNEEMLTDKDLVISNASCTTNCLAPLVKIIDENWGIHQGFMSTIHAFTADQNLQDAPHKDLRRARAASINIVPTSTGAAKALGLVLPKIDGKISASSVRVPIITGSLVELVCILDKAVDVKTVNATFKTASETSLKGILQYSDKPLVSSDIISNPYSSIFDSGLTLVHGNMLKVTAWYDNEAGYSARLAEMAAMV